MSHRAYYGQEKIKSRARRRHKQARSSAIYFSTISQSAHKARAIMLGILKLERIFSYSLSALYTLAWRVLS